MTTKEISVIWLQGSGCTGCSVSILNAVSPKIKNLILDEVVPGKQLRLRFHGTIMAATGQLAITALHDTQKQEKGKFVLVVEGAIPTAEQGRYGSIGQENGRHITILDSLIDLGQDAQIVLGLGSCAAFGGIPSAKPNPTQCQGVGAIFSAKKIATPVINLPGCPAHPDWFLGAISALLLERTLDLDEFNRPKLFYGKLIHENCPRRADFDKGKFAKYPGETGCLYQIGCKGHYTYADCPLRQWNNGLNWCVKAGSPCLGCTEAGFPDLTSPFYEKITLKDI